MARVGRAAASALASASLTAMAAAMKTALLQTDI
jgi:hypothetical protein